MNCNSPQRLSSPEEQGWVAWFASNPVAANLLMALILVAGLITANNLRVEAFPPLPPNSISIDVTYLSGSAKSSEEGVTIKIEEALQGVLGIKKVSSLSHGSGATVTVERISGYDISCRHFKSSLVHIAQRCGFTSNNTGLFSIYF